nr:GNAT family N-acetyltransferase [Deinococcus sp.]
MAGRHVYAAWVAGAMRRGSYLGWLAQEAGQVVAGAGLVLLDWGPTRGEPNPLRARLVNVYTEPAYRRRGLARQLVQTALNEAARLRIGTVTLGASAQASALYLALGFQVRETEMALKVR